MKYSVILVLLLSIAACASPGKLSYERCMKLIQDGTLLSKADRDFCETLNK
jgi:hypothetical protein